MVCVMNRRVESAKTTLVIAYPMLTGFITMKVSLSDTRNYYPKTANLKKSQKIDLQNYRFEVRETSISCSTYDRFHESNLPYYRRSRYSDSVTNRRTLQTREAAARTTNRSTEAKIAAVLPKRITQLK